jgi:hypothetical protein
VRAAARTGPPGTDRRREGIPDDFASYKMRRQRIDLRLVCEETQSMAEKAEKTYTFEEIDQLVKQADLDKLEKQSAQFKASAASPADILGQICPIYKTIRPILIGITQIPFIPASWKKAIKAFIRTMDLICPQH